MESEREEEKWLNGRKRKEKNGENEGGKTVLNLSSLYGLRGITGREGTNFNFLNGTDAK